ncbi:MAG: S41 family peptidase [Bacillota bacterium]
MKKWHVCSIICILIILFISSSIGYANPKVESDELFKEVLNYIEDYYVYPITEEELMEGALRGLTYNLDPYSVYFNPSEYQSFIVDTTGTFGGIGVTIDEKDGYIEIIELIEGAPAQKAGVQPGDTIISIEGQDVSRIPMDTAINLLLGKPGTKVKVSIRRKGHDELLDFTVTREIIKINPVKYEILPENIGYIRISQFNENTSDNLEKAVNDLTRSNVAGFILDLRDNPGGLVDEAVDVADIFIPKGPVVHFEDKYKNRHTYTSIKDKLNKPLVVLVNEMSASASEIVAGAIQDTKSGVIVGTKTYGKGTVQTIQDLENGGGIKLTIARYLTPNEKIIDGVGVQPDIIVENPKTYSNNDLTFAPMIEEGEFALGAKGLNIYGAQQRLIFLDYQRLEANGVMDEAMVEAVKKFQIESGLEATGILDAVTKERLEKEVVEKIQSTTEDAQLKKAVEVLLSTL